MSSMEDLYSVYQGLKDTPHLLEQDDTFWLGAHLVKDEQADQFVWKWGDGLPLSFTDSSTYSNPTSFLTLNPKDDSKGCIRIKLYNGRNSDYFTGNERVLIDRTRCNSQENFICSVEPMFSADLERFNNQSTDPLEQMIRRPNDFVADCDQNQLDNIDTNIDGKFFQFGGPFNGRKTCYYLR